MSKSGTESRLRSHHTIELDLEGNRVARKYSTPEQFQRALWAIGQWALRLSPRPMFGWRRLILRLFGAPIGEQVNVYSSTRIYMPWNLMVGDLAALGEDVFVYNLGKVSIGLGAAISYRAHICAGTHDFSRPTLSLLKPPVTIAVNAWIGTEAFIEPESRVGEGAIVGARAVVVKDVAPLYIVAGNPARTIGICPDS